MANLNLYTGSALRIGSFLEMTQEYVRLINELTAAALRLDNEAPQYIAKVNQLEALVKRVRAFEETTLVAEADTARDSLWRAVYYIHNYLKGLPETHPLCVYVNRLTPVFNTYKNLHNSELMEQTAQTRGFLTEMAKPANAEAAQELGISVLIPYLQTANDSLTQANIERTTTAANRQAELGDETTDEVRKQLVNLLRGIVDRINAANIFFPSNTITAFIQRGNAIADHYRVIGKQTGASSQSSQTSPSSDTPGTDTPGTDTPGTDQGGVGTIETGDGGTTPGTNTGTDTGDTGGTGTIDTGGDGGDNGGGTTPDPNDPPVQDE